MSNIPLSERRKFVGASEIASLFYAIETEDGQVRYPHMFEPIPPDAAVLGCLSRHTTGYRLWHIKAGNIEPDDLSEAERVQAGQHMEPAIAAWAAEKWPEWSGTLRKVRRYITHPDISGFGASRDYELHTPGLPPVEIKNVDGLIFRDEWAAGGDEITAPPMDITLQVQHQIAAGGGKADHGWIVACVGGNRLLRGRIAAHAPTIARIEDAVAAFWDSIADGASPDGFADIETASELYLTGERTAPLDLTGDNRFPDLCARYRRLHRISKRADALLGTVKAQIALKVQDATRAEGSGFRVTYPIVHRKERTQTIAAGTYRGALTIKEIKR
jgi:predicted phage-related endonuclease